jgi:glycosyltransferase involved in cell wall biosynthesis
MTRPARIGFRVLSNPMWRGGINYVVNWSRACASVPADERPEIHLLHADEAGCRIAGELASLAAGVHEFRRAAALDLDMVYPVTQVFEAPAGAPWAGWIPDWQCKHFPDMFDDLERARRDLHYGLLATEAPFLALSSNMALEDTRRLYGERLVEHARLSFPAVIDQRELDDAVVRYSEVRTRHGLPEKFALVCNQWWKHKNHVVVLHALAELQDLDVCCVFTGETKDPRWPEYFDEQLAFITRAGLQSRARILGAIGRREQLALMNAAAVVIQPSLFEGWSTVVEEARALGKLLLLSDFPVHREQAPPGCQFFNASDPAALAEVWRKAWATPGIARFRSDQRQRDFIRDCVRQLVAISRATRAAYDPSRHDPSVLVPKLLARLEREQENPIVAQLLERARAGTRAMVMNNDDLLNAMTAVCERDFAMNWPSFRDNIVNPVLVKRSAIRSPAAPLVSGASDILGRLGLRDTVMRALRHVGIGRGT